MIVHLAVPTHKVRGNEVFYARIRDVIHAEGCELARDWIHQAYLHAEDLQDELHRKEIVREVEGAIERAVAVIADVSEDGTTGTGLQIAWALQQNKPVLALQDSKSVMGVLASAISDPLYTYVRTDDFTEAVSIFLKGLKGN
jgi:hypothetical protein